MKSVENRLRGVHAAAVTPMNAEGSSICRDSVGPLLHFLELKGLNGILIGGTTGEFASLTFDERIQIIDEAASTRGKLALIVGCGSSSLNETVALAAHAGKRNADAILVPPPFYYRSATADGIERFFTEVLRRAPVPVILYHIPRHSGIPITRELLGKLSARHDNLWGIKDTGGKLAETSQFLAAKPGRVLLGSDTSMLSGLKLGVHGIVSAMSNLVPEWTSGIFSGYTAGADVSALQSRLVSFREAIRPLPGQATYKFILRLRGIECGGVRLPLIGLNRDQEEFLRGHFMTLDLA